MTMTLLQQVGVSQAVIALGFLWLAAKLVRSVRHRGHTTPLNGPASPSFFFGVYRYLNESDDPGIVYEQWAAEYGPAFQVPGGFGSSRIVICDPRASAHFYAKETFGYVQTGLSRLFIENLFGRGLLWAEGESHRRQRKALSPAFSNAAIRRLTHVFYDSAYKTKAAWDSALSHSSDGVLIDVQKWMNHIALDSIGIAGFGHDFQSLDGASSSVSDVFESFDRDDTGLISHLIFLLGPVLPYLLKLPTEQNRIFRKMRVAMGEIADELLARTRKEKEGGLAGKAEEKSVIGLLIKAESADAELNMSQEEITAQACSNVLLLAGYETTSISITWALIELCRKLEKQQTLRDELAQFTGTDPTWEQLSALPYLDAIVHEVLRLHPPVSETTRVAAEDDVMPLSRPLVTRTGATVSSIAIAKGTVVSSPIRCMNRSEEFWGPDAKAFVPERWLGGDEHALGARAKEIAGYRHLLTFSDGPRMCLGKGFALAEFKAVLSVLIRSYTFELPDGPSTKIGKHRSVLPRPKVVGQKAANVPLKVRRVD